MLVQFEVAVIIPQGELCAPLLPHDCQTKEETVRLVEQQRRNFYHKHTSKVQAKKARDPLVTRHRPNYESCASKT